MGKASYTPILTMALLHSQSLSLEPPFSRTPFFVSRHGYNYPYRFVRMTIDTSTPTRIGTAVSLARDMCMCMYVCFRYGLSCFWPLYGTQCNASGSDVIGKTEHFKDASDRFTKSKLNPYMCMSFVNVHVSHSPSILLFKAFFLLTISDTILSTLFSPLQLGIHLGSKCSSEKV